MGYVGVPPQSGFITTAKQRVTSSTNNYVDLDHSISSLADVIVWVNFVKQDSTNLTLTTSSRITLGATLVASDIVEIAYLGKAVATQTPSTGSVSVDMLSATGTKSSSTFLAGDNSFKTVSGTTINNNADNRVITGSGTANTLEGEAKLLFDGTTLKNLNSSSGGTANSEANLLVLETSGTNGMSIMGGTSGNGIIAFGDSDDNDVGRIGYDFGNNIMDFKVNGAEGMRIDSTQRLSFGKNAVSTPQLKYDDNDPNFVTNVGSVSYRNHYIFKNTNGTVGSISTTGSNTSFNTSSDYRLKENVSDMTGAIDRVNQLQPKRFNFIADDTNTLVDGFIAHEVSSVIPEAISGDKDGMAKIYYQEDDEIPEGKKVGEFKEYSTTEIQPQAIDQSKLVPLLTSALQEAITKIETLEARVQTLESE